jgi:hypothetical protein
MSTCECLFPTRWGYCPYCAAKHHSAAYISPRLLDLSIWWCAWWARLFDLSETDFFVCGCLKRKVASHHLMATKQLRGLEEVRTISQQMSQKLRQNFVCLLEKYIEKMEGTCRTWFSKDLVSLKKSNRNVWICNYAKEIKICSKTVSFNC